MRPRHPKPDANQAEIVRQVERAGLVVCNVSSLSVADAGCDLYIYGWNVEARQVELHGFEVKVPREQLTESERKFWTRIAMLGGNKILHIARCAEDVLRVFGRIG